MTDNFDVHIDQDDVKPYAANTTPGNDKFLIPAEDAPDFTRAGDN